MPSGAAGMINDPMASAALQYGSHLAQSGGNLMQQNVSLIIDIGLIRSLIIILQTYEPRRSISLWQHTDSSTTLL